LACSTNDSYAATVFEQDSGFGTGFLQPATGRNAINKTIERNRLGSIIVTIAFLNFVSALMPISRYALLTNELNGAFTSWDAFDSKEA
jgi:hypothetical protein